MNVKLQSNQLFACLEQRCSDNACRLVNNLCDCKNKSNTSVKTAYY